MKLKVQQLMDAMLVISQIIRDDRAMPQRGKYRLARMHAKLLPEFSTINRQRDEMIEAYGCHEMVQGGERTKAFPFGEEMVEGPNFTVPPDKIPEFNEAWGKIAGDEIEIDVEPIPLSCLDLGDAFDGPISAVELITLGDLVGE